MLLLLQELAGKDHVVILRVVAELLDKQRRRHRAGLPFGQRVALLVPAPRIGRIARFLIQHEFVQRVDVRVSVQRENEVRVRADRQSEVG